MRPCIALTAHRSGDSVTSIKPVPGRPAMSHGTMLIHPMFTHLTKIVFFIALCGLFVACATVPVQEMSDARQAVEAARRATAASQDSTALRSAEALLQNAEQALAEGNYKQARKDAAAAREQAVAAQAVQEKSSKE